MNPVLLPDQFPSGDPLGSRPVFLIANPSLGSVSLTIPVLD